MKTIKKKHVTIGMVIAFLGAVTGVYSFADEIGFKLDRWAWKSEIEAHEAQFIKLAAKVNIGELTRKRRELVEVEIAIAKYREGGLVPPARLFRQQSVLEVEIKVLRRELGQ